MGGDEKAKQEKKRLKAQTKAEKARAKYGTTPVTPATQSVRWYKDPNWVKAIVAIASLIVMIIALIITIRS